MSLGFLFPGGKLVSKEVNKAGNQDLDLEPPAYKRWKFVVGTLQLVASGVANRTITLNLYDSNSDLVCYYPSSPDITNGQTRRLNITTALNWTQTAIMGVWDYHIGIGDMILDSGWFLRVSTLNGLAGDTLTGQMVFLEA